ncbi:MAG: DUF1566 domain-containing protein [Gammaproteobacteria bacterium]|nr:DUF1566 domain-containing protein [Gammaproteobacteria bacterium]
MDKLNHFLCFYLVLLLFSLPLLGGCTTDEEPATSSVRDEGIGQNYPSNIQIEPRDGSVLVTWDKVEGASEYRVYIARKPELSVDVLTPYNYLEFEGGTYYPVGIRAGKTKGILEVRGVANGYDYYLVMTSVIGNQESLASSQRSFTPVDIYAKIGSDGSTLSDGATNFVCVEDKQNRLMWEVKSNDGSIHDRDDQYALVSINNLLAQANGVAPCSFDDWRMPTQDELATLIYCSSGPTRRELEAAGCNADHNTPTIDTNYFPQVQTGKEAYYWSSPQNSYTSDEGWGVNFYNGSVTVDDSRNLHYVRLVRDSS